MTILNGLVLNLAGGGNMVQRFERQIPGFYFGVVSALPEQTVHGSNAIFALSAQA